ncbi:MAG: hypothetical protein ACE15E_09740 [Acidobacteriota bacterium]
MTGKEFINSVANGSADVIQIFLDIMAETGSEYCLIGGLAVNAYVEPVVSLDVDVVVAVDNLQSVSEAARNRGLRVTRFEHSVNLDSPHSDLRIQLQIDPRYQAFIRGASEKEVLGYRMKVAALGDLLQGKVWAYLDQTRRRSKRQKDLADILRLVEVYPELRKKLPPGLREEPA